MEVDGFANLGHALNLMIPMNGGFARASASTPVALLGILAFTALGMTALLTQEIWRPQHPQPALPHGDGDGERSNS